MGANAGIARGLGGIGVASQVSDTATGVLINLAPIGSDAATLSLSSPADAGSVLIGGAQSASTVGRAALTVTGVAAGVNGLTVTQSAAAGTPTIATTGSDTNINFSINPKGSGTIAFNLAGTTWTFGQGTNTGQCQVASNTVVINGGSAVASVSLGGTAQASNAAGGTLGGMALTVTGVNTGVNGVTVTQSIASSAPSIAATGSDSNIDLTLAAKGTGLVNFSSASVAISGTISPATLAPTTGGATGPSNAAQNSWGKMKWNGTIFYVPLWT